MQQRDTGPNSSPPSAPTPWEGDPPVAWASVEPPAQQQRAVREDSPAAAPARYVGSAALESTLDSTIESSLLGVPSDPLTSTVAAGGQRVTLPEDVETRAVALLADGHEVAAVRLICDQTGCGILDAMRTLRALG